MKSFPLIQFQTIAPILFVAWKLIHRTKFVSPREADLIWGRPVLDAYEAAFADPPVGFWRKLQNNIPTSQLVDFANVMVLGEMGELIWIKRRKKTDIAAD